MPTHTREALDAWEQFQGIRQRAEEKGRGLTGKELDERDRLLEVIRMGRIEELGISRSAGDGSDMPRGRTAANPGFAAFLRSGAAHGCHEKE